MAACGKCGEPNAASARFCSACGSPLATPAPAPPSARKTVTVLFCDLSDSTGLGERLDPESLRRVMAQFFATARDVVERHGGTVEKFIGDAVMAVFGVPQLHEDDALRAARAACELRPALAELNEELERTWGVRLAIRAGINTGEVVAGDPAAGQTLVTGDAVIVAKRLEEAARSGEILVGAATRRLIDNAVVLEPREAVDAKGKSDPIDAWALLAVITGAEEIARRLDAPLVGRAAELRRLEGAFLEAVEARECRLVTLLGPAGIGKSRLGAELVRRVHDEATVLRGRCLPYGDGITFWPLVQIVDSAGGEDGIAAALARVDEGQLVLERIRGAVGGGAPPAGETFWAVRRLFEALAEERPLVVLVEDIHWAQPTFLDLLEYVAGWSRGEPILLLCLARPELLDERPGWLNEPNAVTLTLAPLSDSETEALLGELAAEWPLDSRARDRITEAAEGNPLYVEQMAAMLAEGAPPDAIPPTIQALLSARLDRLTAEERAVLEIAAVAGKEFVRRTVAGLSDAPVDAALMALVRKELIQPNPAQQGRDDAFRFRHALIRDAAYAGIPKEVRADLHERFAARIERHGPPPPELEEIVGYHLEQAYRYREQLGPIDERTREIGVRAGELLVRAGRRAFMRDDMPAAISLLDRGLALVTHQDPARVELARELSTAYWSVGELARAEALLGGVVAAAIAAGDRRQEWYGRLEQAARLTLADPEAGTDELLRTAHEAIGVFGELDDDLGLARAWRRVAVVAHARGRLGEAGETCERALVHARAARNQQEEARIVDVLCTALLYGPARADDAAARCEQMLAEAEGNRLLGAHIMSSLAGLEAIRGHFDEARALAARAEQVYVDLGLRLPLAGLTQVVGPIELLAGDARAAEAKLRLGYEIFEQAGGKALLARQAALLAEAVLAQGREDEARALAGAASDGSRRDIVAQVLCRTTRARVERAEAPASAAVALAAETDALALHADALLTLAEVRAALGRGRAAADAARRAAALYEQKQHVVGSQRAVALVAAPAREGAAFAAKGARWHRGISRRRMRRRVKRRARPAVSRRITRKASTRRSKPRCATPRSGRAAGRTVTTRPKSR